MARKNLVVQVFGFPESEKVKFYNLILDRLRAEL